jgi:predicted phosphoribosyltransferase
MRVATALQRFKDRAEAGRLLADRLGEYAGRDDVVVLGLPRGGVPVAFEIARQLDVPMDVFVVRKLGVPGREELAFGAIATGGTRVLKKPLIQSLGLPPETIEAIDAREMRELERRQRAYRGDQPPPDLAGRTVILVDDGLATGSTMLGRAAWQRVVRGPARVRAVELPRLHGRRLEASGRPASCPRPTPGACRTAGRRPTRTSSRR